MIYECAFCEGKFTIDRDNGEKFADCNVEGRAWCRKCNPQDDPEYSRKVFGIGGASEYYKE